ncbi:hypothetical protein AKJ16_DCAP14657, partial [Drosera capensis]
VKSKWEGLWSQPSWCAESVLSIGASAPAINASPEQWIDMGALATRLGIPMIMGLMRFMVTTMCTRPSFSLITLAWGKSSFITYI